MPIGYNMLKIDVNIKLHNQCVSKIARATERGCGECGCKGKADEEEDRDEERLVDAPVVFATAFYCSLSFFCYKCDFCIVFIQVGERRPL